MSNKMKHHELRFNKIADNALIYLLDTKSAVRLGLINWVKYEISQ